MRCGGCGSADGQVFFRSPPVPVLANALLQTSAEALAVPRGEIALARCPACDLVYNAAFEPTAVRYTGGYENALHFSPRFRAYADALARRLVERHGVRGKLVVEIGCGDGAFLALLSRLGNNRGVGFDPAHDPARALALPAAVRIELRPIEPADAALRPDLVCARHVLEHAPEPLALLAGIRALLGEERGALAFLEVPNALHMLETLAIWDVVYEHCLYFCAASLDALLRRAGFSPLAVEEAYGRQFLTVEARSGPAPGSPTPPARPRDLAALTAAFARAHADKLSRWRDRLGLADREGKRAVLWGAGSKGVTFLNLLGVSPETIPCVVDVNPRKHGCHVAGTGQAIVPPARLAEIRPDLVIVMNPLYRGEVEAELERLGVPAATLVA